MSEWGNRLGGMIVLPGWLNETALGLSRRHVLRGSSSVGGASNSSVLYRDHRVETRFREIRRVRFGGRVSSRGGRRS